MLKQLSFKNVGPAPKMEIILHERLNFLAGDNGLGKSFLLDVAWWALTRTWARQPVVPHLPPADGVIQYSYSSKTGKSPLQTSQYDREQQRWSSKQGRPSIITRVKSYPAVPLEKGTMLSAHRAFLRLA